MTNQEHQGELPASLLVDPKPALTFNQGLAVLGGTVAAIAAVLVLWVVTDLFVIV